MIIDTEFVIAILKFWFLLKTLDEKLESFFFYIKINYFAMLRYKKYFGHIFMEEIKASNTIKIRKSMQKNASIYHTSWFKM